MESCRVPRFSGTIQAEWTSWIGTSGSHVETAGIRYRIAVGAACSRTKAELRHSCHSYLQNQRVTEEFQGTLSTTRIRTLSFSLWAHMGSFDRCQGRPRHGRLDLADGTGQPPETGVAQDGGDLSDFTATPCDLPSSPPPQNKGRDPGNEGPPVVVVAHSWPTRTPAPPSCIPSSNTERQNTDRRITPPPLLMPATAPKNSNVRMRWSYPTEVWRVLEDESERILQVMTSVRGSEDRQVARGGLEAREAIAGSAKREADKDAGKTARSTVGFDVKAVSHRSADETSTNSCLVDARTLPHDRTPRRECGTTRVARSTHLTEVAGNGVGKPVSNGMGSTVG